MNQEEIQKINDDIMQVQAKLKDPKLCRGTLDTLTRVSGYYRSVDNFNAGKMQEYSERSEYKVA